MNYLFEWSSELSVNQVAIDIQHRHLLNQINILLSAIVNNLEPKVIDDVMIFLKQYIDGHLKYEEEYMIENGYPDLESHKIDHQDFINNYEKLKEKYNSGAQANDLAVEIERYLGTWLVEHIGRADKRYATFIEQKNK